MPQPVHEVSVFVPFFLANTEFNFHLLLQEELRFLKNEALVAVNHICTDKLFIKIIYDKIVCA